MSHSEEDADRVIREALEMEAGALAGLDDPGMAELLVATFRGRHRRLAMGGALLNLLLFAGAVFGAVRFLGADDVQAMLRWGALAFTCFATVLAVKVWYWLEMARLSVTREVKRLELQLSRLAERVGDGRGG